MRDIDMMAILMDSTGLMSVKQVQFVVGMADILGKNKPLTVAQSQYLQALYDTVVAIKYGLEPMSTDREFAAKRAISRARRALGK